MEFVILFWITLAIIVGVVAASRGRSGIGWFLLSTLLLSPLLGLILVLCLTDLRKHALEQEIEQRVEVIKRELEADQCEQRLN